MLRRVVFLLALLIGAGGVFAVGDSESADDAVRPLVIHMHLEGIVDGGLAEFMKRIIGVAEEDSAAALLIEMNTYGGRVDAADDIRTALLETSIFTITFIHTNAASAGALIAIATDSIAMSPGSQIGAATPVGQQGIPASSKVISYFRSLMGETARATGRDPRVAEAMVDSTIVLPGMEDLPRPLTLRTDQAIAAGIAQHEARTIEEVLRFNGLEGAEVRLIEKNWAENVVRFLTNPLVSGLLMTIGVLGLISELTSPGIGLPGIAGATCLLLFFGAHYIVDLAQWTDILIFVIGVLLVILELFIPGGIVGIIGGALILTGLILSLIGRIEFVRPPDLTNAFTSVGIALILSVVGAAVILRGFVEMPVFKRLMLGKHVQPGRGDGIPEDARRSIIGQSGVADTALRPGGRVRVDDRYYDATTEGDLIPAGSTVTVIGIDGVSGVVVRQS